MNQQRLSASFGAGLRPSVPILAGLFCFITSLFKAGPSIFGDELGYLSSARVIALREPIYLGGGTTYHPGTGFLYALPALFSSPRAAYLGALAVNALIVGVAVKVAINLAKDIGVPTRSASKAAGLMALFPFVSYYASFALSETLVMATGILITWLCARVDRRPTLGWETALLGLVLGGSWLIHPRLIVAPLVVILISTLSRKPKQTVALTVLSGLSLVLARILVSALTQNIYGSRSDQLTQRFGAIWEADLLLWLSRLGGQTAYIVVSTLGLAGIGGVVLWQMKKKWPLVAASSVGIPCAVLVLSAAVQGTNAQYFVYGRYVEPLLLPALFFGLLHAFDILKSRRVIVLIGGVALIGSAGLVLRSGTFGAPYPVFNSPGLLLYTNLFSRAAVPYVLFTVSGLLIAIVIFTWKCRKVICSLLFGSLIFSTGFALRHSYGLDDMAPRHAGFERDILKTGAFEGVNEVWIDRTSSQPWGHIFGTQWAFSGYDAKSFSNNRLPEGLRKGGASVVIHAGPLPDGFELLAADKWTNFAASRPAYSSQPAFTHPRQTPRSALRSEVIFLPEETDEQLRGRLIVTHAGDAAWFPRGGAFGVEGSVRFVLRWNTQQGESGSTRIDLPSMVFPGETVEMPFEADVAADQITQLTVQGVHEGVIWFSDAGGRIHTLVGRE